MSRKAGRFKELIYKSHLKFEQNKINLSVFQMFLWKSICVYQDSKCNFLFVRPLQNASHEVASSAT